MTIYIYIFKFKFNFHFNNILKKNVFSTIRINILNTFLKYFLFKIKFIFKMNIYFLKINYNRNW